MLIPIEMRITTNTVVMVIFYPMVSKLGAYGACRESARLRLFQIGLCFDRELISRARHVVEVIDE